MYRLRKTISIYPSWTRCLIDSHEKDGVVFLMDIRVTIKYVSPRRIKKIQHLLSLMVRSHSRGSNLGYVMHRPLSRDV